MKFGMHVKNIYMFITKKSDFFDMVYYFSVFYLFEQGACELGFQSEFLLDMSLLSCGIQHSSSCAYGQMELIGRAKLKFSLYFIIMGYR